jgi:hypothetical protein
VNGGCQQLSTKSLMKRQGCRMRAAAKQLVYGGCGANWVAGTGIGGVLLGLAMYVVILELPVVVLDRAEQEIQPLSMDMLLMTW